MLNPTTLTPIGEAPPLPPRNDIAKQPEEKVPELPPRDVKSSRLTFTLEDNLSNISIIRQQEIYSSPIMNESSDLFTINSIGNDNIKAKLETIKDDDPELKHQFWYELINDYSNQIIKNQRIDELEENISNGIPDNLRSLVYLKTLQVRYRFNKDNYNNLLKKASYSQTAKNQELFLESLSIDSKLKDILKIFNYYTNEVISTNTTKLESVNNETASSFSFGNNLPPNNFIIHVSELISTIPHLENEEILLVLLKFNKLFTVLIKDEFFYKINRSLEDLVPEMFLHISKQGINLTTFYKGILFNFFHDQIEDASILFKILDFIVFEGFDFINRYIISLFNKNKETLLKLNGDQLLEFLNSKLFFAANFDIKSILSFGPNVIKYENEYHLIHANSLNNNSNELTNLKEVNDDLIIKINELNHQLENLKITHAEILNQSDKYTIRLDSAQEKKNDLTALKDQLQEKYENLSMKENLKNTIKANKEFSERNADLEAQITELKKSIEDKTSKLSKYAN